MTTKTLRLVAGLLSAALATGAFAQPAPPEKGAKLITLGTPHQGSATARLGAGENARQMAPDNAWLQLLNRDAPAVPLVSVFSYHDNIVLPQESSVLAGAKIVALSGMGHLSMPFSRRIRELTLEEILAASA